PPPVPRGRRGRRRGGALVMTGGLLQIHDPLKPRGHAVGIDLGTTNSLVAAMIEGKPRAFPVDEGGSLLLPSVVHYAHDGSVIVGARARELAAKQPTSTIASVKRFMGKGPEDAETKALGAYRFAKAGSGVRFEGKGGPPGTPTRVSARIPRTPNRRPQAPPTGKVEQAVITVPAYFDDAQRQATRDAGRLAGLEVLRLLNEPTAAALAYGLDKGSQGRFAVYDLGGGTFDISILELVEGVFQVKSTGGDSALGGDGFDRAIAARFPEAHGLASPDAAAVTELLAAAREAKETLTQVETTQLSALGKTFPVRRAEMEAWIGPLLQRTGVACRRALKDAGITREELDGVILGGGSTRGPAGRDFRGPGFGKEPPGGIGPDQGGALGARGQAGP